MSNGNDDIYTTVEIVDFSKDLNLAMNIAFFEDEKAMIPADRIVFGLETYYVRVCWKLTGQLVTMLCGFWQVQLHLESIGTAPEYSSPCHRIRMTPSCDDPQPEYCHTFSVGPDDLKPSKCGTVYYPAVTLSTLDRCEDDGPIWAYATGPSVMFTPAVPGE